MTDNQVTRIANEAVETAARAASAYFTKHGKTYDLGELSEALKHHIKKGFDEGLRDAKEAAACGMDQIAVTTMRASLVQAGIAAAKEVGR